MKPGGNDRRATDISRAADARESIRRKLKGLYATYRFDVAAGHQEGRGRLLAKIEGAEQALSRLDELLAELMKEHRT